MTPTAIPDLLLRSRITWCRVWHVFRRAWGLRPGTYTDTTNIIRSGSRMAAAVKSEDCIGTWSAPKSLFTHNMLRIGHLPSLQIVGTILIHLGCPIGTVNSLPSPFHACGYWTATTAKSWSRVSFIRLSCTVSCFLTFNWMTWNILLMPSRVEFRAAATERLVRSTTGYALGYLRLALTMMVVFGSAPRTY